VEQLRAAANSMSMATVVIPEAQSGGLPDPAPPGRPGEWREGPR
jgi:hypothetical protein